MKRLTLLFLLCVATISSWAHDFVMDGIYYNIISPTKLTVEVTYRGTYSNSYSNEYKGTVTIPSSVTYNGKTYSVTWIGYSAFYGCSGLTSINIPESVTHIGDNAFQGTAWYDNQSNGVVYVGKVLYKYKGTMSETTTIKIKEGTKHIATYAFRGCSNLTSINIPESMTSIGYGAFYECSSLTSITIPESMTSIGDEAFYGCSSLTSIIVEEENPVFDSRNKCNAIIRTSDNVLLVGCSSTIIPSSVTRIDNYAFASCNNLTSITIPESVVSIGSRAFANCAGKLTVNCNIPSASHRQGGVFYESKFSEVIIGKNVRNIGDYAFYGCSSLTSITIPESVTSIGDYAFCGCSNLTAINIPKSVTNIEGNAFEGCTSLTSITIPEGVIGIGYGAFGNCSGLTSITIPESVVSIGSSAFYGCSSLTSITIPESVTSIGDYAFCGCSNLTAINIPKSVTNIEGNAFEGCTSLVDINVEENNPIYDSRDNCNAIINTANNELIIGCSSTIIPKNVTSIRYDAFYGCSSLTSITIPESVTSIGNRAFWDCSNLVYIIVEENNPIYDSRDNCNAIINTANNELIIGCSSTIIPKSVTSIGDGAFYECSSLTSIIIPESVTSIGSSAFSGCSSLTSIAIPEGVTNIGNSAFSGCSSLTSITIPEGVISIGYCAFYGCSSLTSITIPESVVSIGSSAFEDCLLQPLFLYCKNLDNYESYSLNSKSTIYAYKTEIPLIQKRNSCNYVALNEPYTIKDCKSYIHGVDFNLAGNSLFENNVELLSIEVGGQSIAINDSNKYEVYGLDENTQYDIKVTCKVNDSIYNITEQITTKEISVTPYIAEITNTTISVSVTASKDKTCSTNDRGFLFNGKDYNYSGETILISNLTPNESYTISPYAYYGAKKVVGADKTVSTYGLEPNISIIKLTPTTYQAYGHYWVIDACISETGFTNHTEGDVLTLTGLDPSTKYTIEYYVKTKEGSNEKVTTTFTTPALEMTTLNPKVVSNSCAIVAATTNMSDEETNAGFQWRKYEAPETLPSSEGYAAIYDGQLEGYIKNLQATSFYNVRAFYKSTAGKYYYSDWVTFDPSDFSYFEPTVHTYPTEELTANSAKVKGYVLQGTDAITEQGFVYWPTGTNKANATRSVTVPENASIVIAKGQVMNVTLEGLTPSTTYNFCAFVTTASGTIYGEEHSFTTKADETGIELIESEQTAPSIIGYYDLNGHKLSEPQHGITIVRYSDGTARKILTE